MRNGHQRSFKIERAQLQELKKFSEIEKLKKKSDYEKLRGRLGKSTLVVYDGKHGLTLLIQNLSPEAENLIKRVIGKEKKRIIEIDDSGWGEPVGGVIIMGNEIGKRKYSSEEIPVEFFQNPKFKKGDYYIKAVKAVNKILTKLKANPRDTKIRICTGTIFSNVYKFLEKNRYEYKKGKIRGETQLLAEREFNKYLKKINCSRGYREMK